LVPFQTGVTMGTSSEGGAEDVATAITAISFILVLGVVGFLVFIISPVIKRYALRVHFDKFGA